MCVRLRARVCMLVCERVYFIAQAQDTLRIQTDGYLLLGIHHAGQQVMYLINMGAVMLVSRQFLSGMKSLIIYGIVYG